ncbi:MAG: hypothetical protein IKB05_03845 [Alphaproteobacteria bacterium]|nr:hypothetical protein [Alphaproteobacteria bacterium]
MMNSLRRFFSNIICGFIPNRDGRRRMRVVLNSDMGAYLRFIRSDLGTRPRRVRTFVGYLARSLLISVNDEYIYKFPLRRDDSDILARREGRLVTALAPFSPIYVPPVELLDYNGRVVRKYEYISGKQFRKLPESYARAHMDEFATQIAHFMYEIGRANPDEIADLKPSVGAVPGYRYGWTQGDIYDNFLIDMSTHKIIAMIDWEDCYFGDFERLFHRRHVSIASQFMDAVSREYDKLYYKKD